MRKATAWAAAVMGTCEACIVKYQQIRFLCDVLRDGIRMVSLLCLDKKVYMPWLQEAETAIAMAFEPPAKEERADG